MYGLSSEQPFYSTSEFFLVGSGYRIFALVILLAALDVCTTLLAKDVLGNYFLEVGVVASTAMEWFPNGWPAIVYYAEIVLFGSATVFFLSTSTKKRSAMQSSMWRRLMPYLPVLTLLALVLNNFAIIVAFGSPASTIVDWTSLHSL